MGYIPVLERMADGHRTDASIPSPLARSWLLPGAVVPSGEPSAAAPSPGRLLRERQIGAWSCDLDNDRLIWTDGVFDLFGLPADIRIERADALPIYSAQSRESLDLMRAYAIRHRRGFTLDARLDRSDGTVRWMRLTTNILCEGGRARRLFGTKEDITAERAQRLALGPETDGIDSLTGLPDRHALEARMAINPLPQPATMLMIEAAGLPAISLRFGRSAADACLAILAARLMRHRIPGMEMGRTDDTRFAVLFPAALDKAETAARKKRLVTAFGQPIYWQGYLLSPYLTTSVVRTRDASALIRLAEAQLDAPHRRNDRRGARAISLL